MSTLPESFERLVEEFGRELQKRNDMSADEISALMDGAREHIAEAMTDNEFIEEDQVYSILMSFVPDTMGASDPIRDDNGTNSTLVFGILAMSFVGVGLCLFALSFFMEFSSPDTNGAILIFGVLIAVLLGLPFGYVARSTAFGKAAIWIGVALLAMFAVFMCLSVL